MPTLAEKWIEQGVQRGLHQGLEQGLQQGLQQGETKGEAALLVRQLELKFGSLSPEHRAKINGADAETLLVWGERILSAETVEEVFAD